MTGNSRLRARPPILRRLGAAGATATSSRRHGLAGLRLTIGEASRSAGQRAHGFGPGLDSDRAARQPGQNFFIGRYWPSLFSLLNTSARFFKPTSCFLIIQVLFKNIGGIRYTV